MTNQCFAFSGDPNDLSLRKVEEEVLIPKKVREKAKKEKCADEVEGAFCFCISKYNLMYIVWKLRDFVIFNAICLKNWKFHLNLSKN